MLTSSLLSVQCSCKVLYLSSSNMTHHCNCFLKCVKYITCNSFTNAVKTNQCPCCQLFISTHISSECAIILSDSCHKYNTVPIMYFLLHISRLRRFLNLECSIIIDIYTLLLNTTSKTMTLHIPSASSAYPYVCHCISLHIVVIQ